MSAINSRDFSVYSSAWTYFTPGLKDESATPVFSWPNCMGSNIGIKRHLKGLQWITSNNADFYVRFMDVDTQVDGRLDRAFVFVNLEVDGNPRHLHMQGVIILEFRMVGREWKCMKFSGARGIL